MNIVKDLILLALGNRVTENDLQKYLKEEFALEISQEEILQIVEEIKKDPDLSRKLTSLKIDSNIDIKKFAFETFLEGKNVQEKKDFTLEKEKLSSFYSKLYEQDNSSFADFINHEINNSGKKELSIANELIFLALTDAIAIDRIHIYLLGRYGLDIKKILVTNIVSKLKEDPRIVNLIELIKLDEKINLYNLLSVLYLLGTGKSFIEVAIYLKIKESEVKRIVEEFGLIRSLVSNQDLYRIIWEQEKSFENQPIEVLYKKYAELEEQYHCNLKDYSSEIRINQYTSYKRKFQLVEEYLRSDFQLTDNYLATKYNLEVATLKSIITSKEELMKVTSLENAEKILAYRYQNAKEQRSCIAEEYGPLKNKPYVTDEKIFKIINNLGFYFQIIVTFRLSLEDFALIMKYPNLDNLKSALIFELGNKSTTQQNALKYILATYQGKNILKCQEAVRFVNTYVSLKREGKKEEALKMYKDLYQVDQDFDILFKEKANKTLTRDEEKLIALKYKVKYAVPWSLFPFLKANVMDMETPLPKELRDEYELNEKYANTKPTFGKK